MNDEYKTMPAPRALRVMRATALSCVLCGVLAGCAHTAGKKQSAATTRPVLSQKAMMTLDQVQPLEALPATSASTQPSAVAPLEAIQLFAQARAALLSGERFTAVQLLDQALRLDPDSYDLNMAMGQAAPGTALSARAMPALQRAAQLRPDSCEAYLEMSRLQLQTGDSASAIKSLRKAQQTTAYRSDKDVALSVDFYLARALQLAGYDTAALQEYDLLLDRLAKVSPSYRGPTEIMQVVHSPDILFGEVAVLAGRLGEYRAALGAIEQAILEAPGNRQYAIMRVKLLEQAGRTADAREFAIAIVSQFGPNVDVMNLLRDVYANAGGDRAATAALQQRFNQKPNDANVGFALADYLQHQADVAGAQRILQTLVVHTNYRQDAVDRLYDFYEAQGQTLSSARLLIEASAKHPEELSGIALKMDQLARLSRSNHLRLRDLQNMQVESWAEPARLYWTAKIGEMWKREETARAALEKAVRIGRPYAPAYRSLLDLYWARGDWDDARKAKASQELIDLATAQHDLPLAAELKGMVALSLKKPGDASAAFLEAMRLGDSDPELMLGYALVQKLQGNPKETERVLLKITDDYPSYEAAYAVLMQFYLDGRLPQSALKTLQRWLVADPRSVAARLYQVRIFQVMNRNEAAEKVLLELFEENADNADVLNELGQLYKDTRRLDTFAKMLEQKRQGRPDIRETAEMLVLIYRDQQRIAEAMRVIEELRKSAAGDSDLLYYVSGLYGVLDDRKNAETVLEQALMIDPEQPSAANDLGYYLAEENRDLDRAQQLVDIAVKGEPDNQMFLDSYGWVLYKRGRFEDAVVYLKKAIAQTVNPDGIILDHLGDACYRIGQKRDAVRYWEEASQRLAAMPMDSERNAAALRLQRKLDQYRRNQPVQVAPTAQEAAATKKTN